MIRQSDDRYSPGDYSTLIRLIKQNLNQHSAGWSSGMILALGFINLAVRGLGFNPRPSPMFCFFLVSLGACYFLLLWFSDAGCV